MVAIRRCFIALAPDSVKVNAKREVGSVSVFFKILAIRSAIIWVLPVPGPAITITGPSIVSTANCCAGLSLISLCKTKLSRCIYLYKKPLVGDGCIG